MYATCSTGATDSTEYRSLLHELVDPLTEYRISNLKHPVFQDPFTLTYTDLPKMHPAYIADQQE
jgi:hypothetical protein